MRINTLALLFWLLTGCSTPLSNIVGVDNPSTPASKVKGTAFQIVYVATTRKRSSDETLLFSSERDPTGLSFAKVSVSIPPIRTPGHVVRPAQLPPDPRRNFLVLNPVVFAGKEAFKNDLNRTLNNRARSEREVLVFIHGYNTDLPASVMRMAQIVQDTGFKGVPIVFSWPSRARTFQYAYDLNSALHARDELSETVRLLASTNTTGLNFVSHSMGNILAVEAMRQDQLTGEFNKSGKISSIVLAAPDIDVELFEKQLKAFPKGARNFYILVSEDDKALALSRQIAGGIDRVGDEEGEVLAKLGVTVIDLTAIRDPSNLNHSKFASAHEFVQLIGGWLNEEDAYREPDADDLARKLPVSVRIIPAITD
ncbi:alpha/beta hydrolase [Roseibium sp. M-1]